MSDVTGPIATLPGTVRAAPKGTPCDDCGEPATRRIQGETDSFGAEMHDLCDACAAKAQQEQVDTAGPCDWCRQEATSLVPARDYEEGLSGPVYRVCGDCRVKQQLECADDDELQFCPGCLAVGADPCAPDCTEADDPWDDA